MLPCSVPTYNRFAEIVDIINTIDRQASTAVGEQEALWPSHTKLLYYFTSKNTMRQNPTSEGNEHEKFDTKRTQHTLVVGRSSLAVLVKDVEVSLVLDLTHNTVLLQQIVGNDGSDRFSLSVELNLQVLSLYCDHAQKYTVRVAP